MTAGDRATDLRRPLSVIDPSSPTLIPCGEHDSRLVEVVEGDADPEGAQHQQQVEHAVLPQTLVLDDDGAVVVDVEVLGDVGSRRAHRLTRA